MPRYLAEIQDMKYPLGYLKVIEGKRIDAINKAIVKTGKVWPNLELPKKIEPGKYFRASFDGWEITILKYPE